MANRISTALISVAAIVAASPALAQVQAVPAFDPVPAQQTNQRLDRLEIALRDLQGVIYSVEPRSGVPAGTPISMNNAQAAPVSEAELSVRLANLEQSLATLTGEVELLAFRFDQQRKLIDQMAAVDGPEYGEPALLPIPEDASNTAPISGGEIADGAPQDLADSEAFTVLLPDDPDAAYDMAYNSVLAADYDAAEANLEAFVAKFPTSPQVADAKFLLGEVYLATGSNGDAARVFLDHVGSYRNDPRSPEAYLKLGISFARLDRTDEACKVFLAGRSKFTNLPDALRRRYDAEQGAADCR